METDIWYPSDNPSSSPLPYGYFLHLLEERSNRFQDDTVFQNMSSELIQYLAMHLQITDTATLTGLETGSHPDAGLAPGHFPLVVYMCSYNGMSYENIHWFEFLASHGYMVACITSVGLYPGNMSTRMADLTEQVNDGLFAIRLLKKTHVTDSSRIGTIGYSWGGLAAVALAANSPDIKCVLSFDGSEMHYYGESKEEDRDFDEIRKSPSFLPARIRVPYAYLESGHKQDDREVDSIFNMQYLVSNAHVYARFQKAVHEDFSGLPSLLSKQQDSLKLYEEFCHFSLLYFDHYLKGLPSSYKDLLTTLYKSRFTDSAYPGPERDTTVKLSVGGQVMDAENNSPLAFVNVGIPNKNTGTVTRRDGRFEIKINAGMESDSLKFSCVGYSGQTFCIKDIRKSSAGFVVRLTPKIAVLHEVEVIQKLQPVKILGNTTTTKMVSVGLPLKFLGSEIGVKINLGKNPVWLKNFNFNISDTRLDTAVFRLNIYRFKNGKPVENILQKNILIPVGSRPGRYTVNLSEYRLVLKEDILVSIEWIEGSTSAKEHGAIYLSASFLSAATWHRLTSQAEWKKASGLGVGFNIGVQKIRPAGGE